jgi:hypothetical protein
VSEGPADDDDLFEDPFADAFGDSFDPALGPPMGGFRPPMGPLGGPPMGGAMGGFGPPSMGGAVGGFGGPPMGPPGIGSPDDGRDAFAAPSGLDENFDADQFIAEVFDMWTDTDAARRRAVLERYFAVDVKFHDPVMDRDGYDGLEQFSDSLRSRFPDAQFSIAKPPEKLSYAIRAYWFFGPATDPQAVTGMDFIIFKDNKVAEIFAFLDLASAD